MEPHAVTPTVDVVIPVHGHWELTERCLASLSVRDPCVRNVIVVDDASPDETPVRLAERFDVVPLILAANAGFSAACNAGARAASADAIFFLNNDTLVAPGTIERLATTLAEADVAAVGPKLLNADGTMQAAGFALLPNRTNFERVFAYLDRDVPQGAIPYAPLALSGAALLVRRDAFFAVRGFDEGYRNGHEDTDLCLRLWANGHRLRYEPRAQISHLEGASRGGKTLDDSENERYFTRRWTGRLAHAPCYEEPPPAVLDLHWQSANPLEDAVRRSFRAALRAYAGARIVESGSAAARLFAFFDRRKVVRVEHRGTRSPVPVLWCAPSDAIEAAALVARRAARYWVPSNHAASLLQRTGVPADRVHVTRPGFPTADRSEPRAFDRVVVVRSERTDASQIEPILAALGPTPSETVVAERAGADVVARLRDAPLVIFADDGDPWGLLGTAAMSAGAVVVARATSPFVEVLPSDTFVPVGEGEELAETVRDVLRRSALFGERGPRAARYAARCIPDVYAGRRVRELARALAHGIPDVRTLTVTEAVAATFAEAGDGAS